MSLTDIFIFLYFNKCITIIFRLLLRALEKLIEKKIESTEVDKKNFKMLAMYFSAKRSPACQKFTPKLIKWYKKINEIEEILEHIEKKHDKKDEDQILIQDIKESFVSV